MTRKKQSPPGNSSPGAARATDPPPNPPPASSRTDTWVGREVFRVVGFELERLTVFAEDEAHGLVFLATDYHLRHLTKKAAWKVDVVTKARLEERPPGGVSRGRGAQWDRFFISLVDASAYAAQQRAAWERRRESYSRPGWTSPGAAKGPSVEASFAALGLRRPCTEEEVRRAYRIKAKEAHPDKGGTSERFIELRQAFDVAMKHCRKGVPV